MKITAFDDLYPTLVSAGGTILVTSSGSNAGYGHDVTGTPGDLSVQGLRQRVSLASNMGDNTLGTVLTTIQSSPWVAAFAVSSNTGVSYGSNSTRVSEIAAVGAATTVSRTDHIHDGIGTVTASSSNTLQRGTVNLRAGSNVSFGLTDTDGDGEFDTLTVNSTATGGTPGSGTTVKYGSLKPATPLDDFAAASLDGAWSAHSSTGSFATTDCYTQAIDGSHLSMGLNAKMGCLYRSTTNVDQEWLAGGMLATMRADHNHMFGIAVLDSSGTGVGLVVYGDGNAYLCNITTWLYASYVQTFTGYGHDKGSEAPYAMRITRVGNSWTGYLSLDGLNWVASSSSSVTITAAYLAVGLFYDGATAYRGRVNCEWVHKV